MTDIVDLDLGFRLGDWDVKPRQFTLQRGEESFRLEPKVMAVLVCLAEHAGEPVTRDEFAERVWAGRIVSDEVLSRDISLLRTHLGDDARTPSFIQTLPRVGYRLIAPVLALESGPTTTKDNRWQLAAGAGGIVVLLIALAWLGAQNSDAPDPDRLEETTVAVLPFTSLTGDEGAPDGDYFGDGLADEIFGALAGHEGIRVVARTSSFALRDTDDDIRIIGKRLGAGSVLEGTVRRDDERLRVTARLLSANDGLQLWSQSYERTLADIFAVQHEIAQAIAEKLAGSLVSAPPPPTTDLEAYQLFLRGHHALRRRGPGPVRRAVTLFESAVERDPRFGRAYVGLAEALILVPAYTGEPFEPYLERAVVALNDARVNGTVSSRSHSVLGFIHFQRWNWSAAEAEYRQALSEAPEDPELRQWYSQFLASTGHLNAAMAEADRAAILDPLSPTATQRLAVMAWFTGDLERANRLFEMATELGIEPQANPRAHVGLLLMQGQATAAANKLDDTQRDRLHGDDWIAPVIAAISAQGDPKLAAQRLASAYAAGEISSELVVGALFMINDPDLFYAQILPLVAEHMPFDIEVLFIEQGRALRADPRFTELITALGLIDYWRAAGWPEMCEGGEPEGEPEEESEGWCRG